MSELTTLSDSYSLPQAPLTQTSEPDLIEAAQAGDREAQQQLLDAYEPSIAATANRYAADEYGRQDLQQSLRLLLLETIQDQPTRLAGLFAARSKEAAELFLTSQYPVTISDDAAKRARRVYTLTQSGASEEEALTRVGHISRDTYRSAQAAFGAVALADADTNRDTHLRLSVDDYDRAHEALSELKGRQLDLTRIKYGFDDETIPNDLPTARSFNDTGLPDDVTAEVYNRRNDHMPVSRATVQRDISGSSAATRETCALAVMRSALENY